VEAFRREGTASTRDHQRSRPLMAAPRIAANYLRRWSLQSMAIVNMPIYRQLFDFLCLASIAISVARTERERRWCPQHARWNADSSNSALAHASEAIRHRRRFWNPQIVCREKSQAEKRQPGFHSWPASQRFRGRPCSKANGPKKLSAAASFKRLEGRRTDLMTSCFASACWQRRSP
jgi:hypothetical protein